MKKELGFIGLGKMGLHMVSRLRKKGWNVTGFDIDPKISDVPTIAELVTKLSAPRVVWLMVPAGKPVDMVLEALEPLLQKGDIVVDGGNSFYKDSARRAKELEKSGIHYLDTGVSGGPVSIKLGMFAIMVGGKEKIYDHVHPLLKDLSDTPSVYMGESGAGHFTKMIHNGIEYGMMQSLAEGFTILKKSPFKISVQKAAEAYSHNSIISSRLVNWLIEGFQAYGEDLERASGSVAHTGEGEWTVKTAKELGVQVPVIKGAFDFRIQSQKHPSYTGKILSMLRAVFGGHKI